MATALQTIQTLVRSLDRSTANNGIAALDAAIRACSGYRNTASLVNDFLSKCLEKQYKSDSEIKAFLKKECGINLDNNNTDTGAITGMDAGSSSTAKTAETVVPEPYFSNPPQAIQFRYRGTLGSSKDHTLVNVVFPTLDERDSLYADKKRIIAGLYNWWIVEGIRLIKDSYGLYVNKNQDSTDRRVRYIYFGFEYKDNDTRAHTNGKGDHLNIIINMKYFSGFSWYKNGNTSGYSSKDSLHLDRLMAHELTHAMFMLNVKPAINNTLPEFFTEGIAELVHGIDDDRGSHMISLLRGNSLLQGDLAAALSFENGTGHTDAYAAGYMLLRYLAKQVSSGNMPPLIKGLNHSSDNTSLTVTTAFKGTTVDTYYKDVVTIDARKAPRAISILGNSNNNTIYASARGGFVRGGYGADTLYGGAGVDTFFTFGVEGHDTIWGYQSTRDLIQIGEAKYNAGVLTSAAVEGNDVVLKIGNGSFTIKDGADKYIKINDGYGNISYSRFVSGTATYNSGTARFTSDSGSEAYTLYQKSLPELAYNGARTALTARKSFNGTAIDANQFWWTLKSVNVAAAGQGVTVYGNANVTSMVGSNYDDALYAKGRSAVLKGGKGKDTLQGGTVSSKLYGGADDDLIYGVSGTAYLYGEAGNDSILGGQGKNYLYGGLGDDTLVGGEGINVLSGDNGNDILSGGSGTNTLSGGNGNDSLIGGKGKNTLSGGNGDDYLEGGKGEGTVNKLSGGNGKDRLLGGEGENTLHGGNGDDELRGGSGTNLLYGDAGNDELYGGSGSNTLRGGIGNDKLQGGSGTNLLYGEAGNDELYGGSGNNSLYGGAGNDILTGHGTKNELYGGAGNDTLTGSDAAGSTNLLKGEAGNDTLTGGAGENTLWGGAGKDILTGGTGKNTFYFASLGEMSGDTITNLREADTLYFYQLKGALDLDAIYQNYNLGRTTGKNTIALTDDKLTLTDKNKRKYTMTLTGGYTGSITLENRSGQRQSFTL